MNKLNCILLIDDNRATNYLHKALIDDLAIARQVSVVSNGKEALNFVQEQLTSNVTDFPELILVDVKMPVMDGFEFVEAYKEAGFDQKTNAIILMLTTSTNPKDLARIDSLGVAGILTKPLTEESLLDVLNKHFDERQGLTNQAI
jgi:CheY-like chemotaxis protein